MKNNKLKPPVSYYGGKQTMASLIIRLIPAHSLYNEPFFGGGAVFFAKEPSEVEIINDLKGDVVNFYRVIQQDFGILRKLIIGTLHSRQLHREAEQALKYPDAHSPIKRAWAFWVQCNMSYASNMFAGWGYERKTNHTSLKIHNKRLHFMKYLRDRFQLVQIECNDALQVIKSRDCDSAFHYVDPPYYNSDCGHYKGYTLADFTALLEALSNIKGKFLLSSYHSDVLAQYVKERGWYQYSITKRVAVTCKTDKVKTEVLTANYDIEALMKS